ncbi:ubiquitinyl hydrolase 1 [Malassezia vespertilionis]|uniref:Ubiquitin carboxyl-terminal hydrolase n=1 Tax=Malassezia vespertilionis TaxID=2020962 RepID=A0A2N1JAT7_9BASI|nr:ubiquitinyl hydrolase 1 [Malassezia vespertilionis]PKI83659.1 hypothetical protein MVES_002329 [Malassezia vespertilionis]WFD07109.1 ubiquitinyl hydrolase 1 [Malassezia vespertilionis]
MAQVVHYARGKGAASGNRTSGARTQVSKSKRTHEVSADDVIKPGALLKSLLDDPVRFVGSQRDELRAGMTVEAARAAKYEVVNDTEPRERERARPSYTNADEEEQEEQEQEQECATGSVAPLYTPKLFARFPRTQMHAAGLYNRGNTCYMNSVMQALLHTPPLATAMLTQSLPVLLGRYGIPHTPKQAVKFSSMFNAVAALKEFFERAWQNGAHPAATAPSQFINNLRKFAKPLRPGRQEDAHEYLRLLLEAMQQASICFAKEKPKFNDPVLSTTLVQSTFGGRLRSRVTCHSCRHNSDTYDPIMDLSLDVRKGINSVKQALDVFTAPESLSGTEKYRCDHCKKRVDATKRFSIDAAPFALTVHLKRFGIFGNKINHAVSFGERLHLGKYMSERTKGLGADEASLSMVGAAQQYRLYAVVHHFGSGPNVGHYVASTRAPDGQWMRMDDSCVTRMSRSPLDDPSAYLLFYLREPVGLDAMAKSFGASSERRAALTSPDKRNAVTARKRKMQPLLANDEDVLGERVERGAYEALVSTHRAPRYSADSADEASVDMELAGLASPASAKKSRRELKKRKKRRMALESHSPRH